MPDVAVRKQLITVEEILHEGGPVAAVPLKRGAALAVIANPFAGRYVEDIAGFMEDLKPLGLAMARRLLAALGARPPRSRATARAPSSAPPASWSTERSGTCRGLRHARAARRRQGDRASTKKRRRPLARGSTCR